MPRVPPARVTWSRSDSITVTSTGAGAVAALCDTTDALLLLLNTMTGDGFRRSALRLAAVEELRSVRGPTQARSGTAVLTERTGAGVGLCVGDGGADIGEGTRTGASLRGEVEEARLTGVSDLIDEVSFVCEPLRPTSSRLTELSTESRMSFPYDER